MRSGSPRDFSFLRSLGSTVFNGARVMEKHGLIHRDIKLENVLYIQAKGDQPASMHLADFGLSLRLEDLKRSGKPQGTLGYGAPEMRMLEVANWRMH